MAVLQIIVQIQYTRHTILTYPTLITINYNGIYNTFKNELIVFNVVKCNFINLILFRFNHFQRRYESKNLNIHVVKNIDEVF